MCVVCMCVWLYGCVVFSGTIKHLMKDVADPITTREGKSIFPDMKKLIQSTIPESELYTVYRTGMGGGGGGRRGGKGSSEEGGERREGEGKRRRVYRRRRVYLPLGFWLQFHRSA